MNRSDEIDSYLSLDEIRRAGEYAAMLIQPYQLYVERTDEARNMARFYAMTIEPGLFGDICLTRRWGRIGVHGQMKAQHFASEQDAVAAFLDRSETVDTVSPLRQPVIDDRRALADTD